jgi:hypothetical protein
MSKVYEVTKQIHKFKKGDIILEEDVSAETLKTLLESNSVKVFDGELMFDNSSTVNTESF